MKNMMETIFHIPCEEDEFQEADLLPLFLRGAYRFKIMRIAGVRFLTAEPMEKVNLATMRKHRNKLMEVSGIECAFQLKAVSAYVKQKMLEEGISFIVEGKELYLPFLGIVLNQKVRVKTAPARISYLTQKMLLTILYEGISSITVTEMAKRLVVSKMSVTRCFDELSAYHPEMFEDNGKAGRHFRWNKTKRELWEMIRPLLRNPIEKEFLLDCALPCPLPRSGLTAISYFSMLEDNAYGTYAITRQTAKDYKIEMLPQVPQGEIPHAVVQVMGYVVLHEDDTMLIIDPLSAVLSLSDKERNDPRIERAIEEIMEEFVYDGS